MVITFEDEQICFQQFLTWNFTVQNFGNTDQTEFQAVLCADDKRRSNNTCYDAISEARTLLMTPTRYARAGILDDEEEYQAALLKYMPFMIHYNSGSVAEKTAYMERHGFWYLDANKNCDFGAEDKSPLRLL